MRPILKFYQHDDAKSLFFIEMDKITFENR